ncbi:MULTISPECIES: PASTA domain-containing protein [Nocardia]|uniref:PASTA domain-containing protein n=1 Tax=Nocardia TaxID=1817 RepID=UPI001895F571|nr:MULTISPECIES: PASTA domain-containing protein [Nocardia]MBF6216228.1 PASTA domain-containing protein [Nocardia puris]MBF6574099.1 PASTA domain-containing protein [Nocardia farcinica]
MIGSVVAWFRTVAGVLPKWKFWLTVGIFCFTALGAVTSSFSSERGFGGALLYAGLAMATLLYLAAAARRQIRRTSPVPVESKRSFPWIPIGVVASVALVIAGAALAPDPHRDPAAVMPDVVGMNLSEATDLLDALDLKVRTTDDTGAGRQVWVDRNWTVTRQHPDAATVLGDRSEVELGVVKLGEQPGQPSDNTPSSPAPVGSDDPAATPPSAPVPVEQARNACVMIDPSALSEANFSPHLQQPLSQAAVADDPAIHACANDLGEISIEITVHPTAVAAIAAAEFATAPDILTTPYTPFARGTRQPLPGGGAKVIATETGVSRISWHHDIYSILLEINSDPVVPGLPPRHPFDTLDHLADRIIARTTTVLSEGTW